MSLGFSHVAQTAQVSTRFLDLVNQLTLFRAHSRAHTVGPLPCDDVESQLSSLGFSHVAPNGTR